MLYTSVDFLLPYW